MKIIGFNFNKINIEKKSDKYKDMKISNDIGITGVNHLKAQNPFQSKEEILEVTFNYDIDYSPNIAKVNLTGTIIIMVDSKTSKEFLKKWKNKQLPEEHRIQIFNVIFRKSNLKAIQLEDELNLPLHISLPSVRPGK